ncbi:MAG TPA: hypothetical protein VFG38_20055 [Pseudomonadales bacterium]|nr:hypothetical protein [Pseudomonadales bacterium]
MAELHGNPSKNKQRTMAPLGAWGRLDEEDSQPRNPIEVRGNAYIAFCKPWAPVWVDDETETD